MLFTTRNNLFRQLFTHKIAKAICCGIAALNVLSAPVLATAANPTLDANEYEDWGLDYPGATPGTNAPAESEAPVAPNPAPTASAPAASAPTASAPVGSTVPQDIAASIEQTAVHVIAFYADGNHMVIPGWVVDTERRIILTFALFKDATKIHVAYPQVPSDEEDSFVGSEAVILKYDSKTDVAYLQAKSMPQQLANLSVSKGPQGRPVAQQRPTPQRPVVSHKPTPPKPRVQGGHNGGYKGGQHAGYNGGGYNGGQNGGYNRPAASQNPLVGQWYLQDTVNGTQIQIAVAFDAQGQFALQMASVDAYGNQNQDASQGTYSVQGNTLTMNTNEGVEQSNFWFENGLLYVQMASQGTTLIFQPAS